MIFGRIQSNRKLFLYKDQGKNTCQCMEQNSMYGTEFLKYRDPRNNTFNKNICSRGPNVPAKKKYVYLIENYYV